MSSHADSVVLRWPRRRWLRRPVAVWVRGATYAQAITSVATPYGYFWWIDAPRPERFYALGNFGQYVTVAPDADTVVVRLGRDWGVDNSTWRDISREIADQLTGAAAATPASRLERAAVSEGRGGLNDDESPDRAVDISRRLHRGGG
jgi:CubicO group peptidase (beta-lactamase class C family)